MYALLAFLPGMPTFIAKLGDQIGTLTPDGFRAEGEHMLQAALHKYGFRELTPPQALRAEATPQELVALSEKLAAQASEL